MPQITLPDGSKRDYENPVSVAEIAESIGPGLAKAALAGRVDGSLVDTSFTIDADAEVAIITERDDDGLEVIRHSCAHLMAQAVQRLFPKAQVTVGPVVEDGFFYDFAFERPFTPEDLQAMRAMRSEDTLSGELARMILRACSGKCEVAPISTIASTRSGWPVAICSSVIPPVLIPIALKLSTPIRSRKANTSRAACLWVTCSPVLVERPWPRRSGMMSR